MPGSLSRAVAGMAPPSRDKAKRLLDDDGEFASPTTSGGGNDPVAAVQAQVDAVTSTMQNNVNVMVDNMERTTQLEDASSQLAVQARAFQSTARTTRRHMWWQLCKQRLVVGGVLFLIVLLIILSQTAWKSDDN